eukprot:TRINITY_DN8273_c0_g1_i1.p1 TRINITY_DN8273_c0_g1~~TRINITY_DN8273_c0_g1_i1.p1  ORF type:complete len:447 (-),score=108.76 TRINITY_DN8273_c0_g1_i1:39-1379(-)
MNSVEKAIVIDLKYHGASEVEILEIFQTVGTNNELDSLLVSGNDLSMDSIEVLADSLMRNESLVKIEMSYCNIDDEKAELLTMALNHRNTKLTLLELAGNSISSTTAEKMRDLADQVLFSTWNDEISSFRAYSSKVDKKKVVEEVGISRVKDTIPFQNVTLLREIYVGGGSGAIVYEGLVDGWRCAIKQLDITEIGEYEHFAKEISMLESLPYHPNIVRYLHHDIKGQFVRLYVTQYHSSLRNVIKQKNKNIKIGKDTPFTLREVCIYAIEIIDGLEFLHDQSVIHRDLKSHNIFVMLDSHGQITQIAIGDFDAAKRVTSDNQAKTFIGTPDYMAPEVVSQTGSYTNKVDIWSFGMVLFELLTLDRPYQDVNFYLVPDLIKSGKRPKIDRTLLPDDDQFDSVLSIFFSCTNLDPEQRPSLQELREDFEDIIDEDMSSLDDTSSSDY